MRLGCSCVLLIAVAACGCSSTTSGPNRAPVANAGPDQAGEVGKPVSLDGRGSFDPDGDALNYQWEMAAAPAGADLAKALSEQSARQAVATLVPDRAGLWLVRLTVSDTRLASVPDVAEIRVKPAGCVNESDCNDDVDCTTDRCNQSTRLCENVPDNSRCADDGLYCNGAEFCDAQAGCSHRGDPCAGQGACDETNDLCAECGDGIVSNSVGEQCDPGRNDNCCDPSICRWVAAGGADPQGKCDGVVTECSAPDTCDGAGNCTDNGFLADGTECGARSCSDGQWLRQTCQGGSCTGSEVLATCDDSNECTQNLCAAVSGCYYTPVGNGAPCASDGQFCNGAESCQGGVCTSPGNPCPNPSDCDETNDRCGACGDGVVSAQLGEECDPGAPARNNCCHTGTCKWVVAGEADPQNYCSGAPECKVNVCGAGGACTTANASNGTSCGSGTDTECDNPDTCLNGVCQTNYEQSGTSCGSTATTTCSNPDTCDGSGNCLPNHLSPGAEGNAPGCPVCQDCNGSGACGNVNSGDQDVGCNEGQTVCSNADACNGSGVCNLNHLSAGAEGNAPGCPVCQDCNGSGACGNVNSGQQDVGCDAPATQCSGADTCNGGGVCLANHFPANTLCPGDDGQECDSTCNGSGVCVEGIAVPNNTPCQNSTGICCNSLCQTGWSCCVAEDCDDNNDCTSDTCPSGSCSSTCPSPSCMVLDVASEARVNTAAPLVVDMCPGTRDVGKFACFSSRNQEVLVEEHFEAAGFGAFTTSGTVTGIAAAQNPNTYNTWGVAVGTMGVQICNDMSWMRVNPITTGRYGLLLAVSLADNGLDNGETLGVYYSYDGNAPTAPWRALALVGDAQAQPYRDYFFILPPDAENNSNMWILFFQAGGGGGVDCAYIDDVYFVDLASLTQVQTLLSESFDTSYGVFSTSGNVSRITDVARTVVEIRDNTPSYIQASVNTTGVNPSNLLVLDWEWRDTPNTMDNADDYALVEYSLDGASWRQLSGVGRGRAPSSYVRYRAVFPCEAIGVPNLRVRFITPVSADHLDANEGIRVDNVSVVEYSMQDVFGLFTDAGSGFYTSTVSSSSASAASIRCRHGCGAGTLWSNTDGVRFTP